MAAVATLVMTGCASSGTSQSDTPSATTSTPSESATPDRERISLNVGYIDTSINGVGVIAIANEMKLWDAASIDANLVPFTNGPTAIQAMQSGQIDIAYIGGGAVWLPATGQATIIAPSETSEGDVVLAQPDAGITTLQDLKGKRIGYPEGGSGEMILSLALDKAGLTDADVEKVALDPPSVVTAFVGKQIDVAAIFSPLSAQILESVPDTVTLAKNTDFTDTVFMGAWVANNDFITSNADAVERFLEVYIQANDFRISDTTQAVQWASDESGTPVEQLTSQAGVSKWTPSDQILKNNEDGTTYSQFESLEKVFVRMGRMDQVNDPTTFVNVELFGQAMEALK